MRNQRGTTRVAAVTLHGPHSSARREARKSRKIPAHGRAVAAWPLSEATIERQIWFPIITGVSPKLAALSLGGRLRANLQGSGVPVAGKTADPVVCTKSPGDHQGFAGM